METILISNLIQFIGYSIRYGDIEISLDELKSCLNNYVIQTKECSPYKIEFYTKDWHIGRIKYFVDNPQLITPIDIYDGDLEEGFITDGNHRYMASLILNKNTINCYYNGSENILEKLKNQ